MTGKNITRVDLWSNCETPSPSSETASQVLNGLKREDVFVVRRLAIDIAVAITREQAFKDDDMVEVVRKLSAILESTIAWLARHGVNGRALRRAGSPS